MFNLKELVSIILEKHVAERQSELLDGDTSLSQGVYLWTGCSDLHDLKIKRYLFTRRMFKVFSKTNR